MVQRQNLCYVWQKFARDAIIYLDRAMEQFNDDKEEKWQ
jgi:hypothetical protein